MPFLLDNQLTIVHIVDSNRGVVMPGPYTKILAYVNGYDLANGRGTAITEDLMSGSLTRVKFDKPGARKIYITNSGGFHVTHDRDARITPVPGMWLVMLVKRMNSGGWKANLWGRRPGPDWAHDYIKHHAMERYVGKHFEYCPETGEKLTGVIARVVIAPELLTIRLTDASQHGGPLGDHAREFRLDHESHDGRLPDGRLCITLRSTGEQLVFGCPKRR